MANVPERCAQTPEHKLVMRRENKGVRMVDLPGTAHTDLHILSWFSFFWDLNKEKSPLWAVEGLPLLTVVRQILNPQHTWYLSITKNPALPPTASREVFNHQGRQWGGGRGVVVMWENADSAQCGAEWRSCVEWFQECIRSWGDNISVSDLGSVDPVVFHCVGVCLSVTCFHYWQTGHVEKHYPPSWQQVDVLPNVWRIPVEFTP